MGDTEPVRGMVNNLGIDSSARRGDGTYRIPKQPSICLGAADLTVFEMTGAYAAFANNGMFSRPYVIKKIEDKNGRIIYRSIPEERVALPPNTNYVMVEMLKHNVKGGAGINALKSEVGGKTGTTNDFSDGWFMGVTPRLVVGTWVGGEDRWIRFLSLEDGQGARMARPIFASFIERLEKDANSGYDFNAKFKVPPGDLGIELNCAKYAETYYGRGGGYGTGGYGDEESFGRDIYNDEVPGGGIKPATPPGPNDPKPGQPKPQPAEKPKGTKKADDGFGG
jgi:penicillin-binding protein 1A